MDNKQFPKNAISHKDLNGFLIKAKKDIYANASSENNKFKEENDFNELIKIWTEASQKILLAINRKEKVLIQNRNPKSLMAFGAMGAHINMALQALKASESDQ